MKTLAKIFAIAALLLFHTAGAALRAQTQEKRLALVIGNSNYAQKPIATAANDAGLVAQTLQAAGFDVVGARDLDGETLRKSLRDFIDKVRASGPDTVAMVYLAGYAMQLAGENYFIPTDAKIARDSDVPIEGLRISDYTRQLSALPLKAGITVLDAARDNPFAKEGQAVAGGLALVEPEPKMLIAYNSAPGTIAPESAPPYGPYAQALAEMIRQGGLPLRELSERVRLRVSEMTKGAQIPWDAEKVEARFVFFERAPDAPAAAPPEQTAAIRNKPIRDFEAKDAFVAALERDTLPDYENFLIAFPNDPLAKRVRAIVAARREAMTWRRSYRNDTPQAYWSYLRRYPNGPHSADARRRLAILAAALEPPPQFATIEYDVPPPPPDEIVYVDRPVLYFGDPVFAFVPPPPPPVFFLPPPPPDFVVLLPPPPPIGIFVLPQPLFVPIPVFVSAPAYVAPPPNNIIFNNIHNTTVINNVINNPAPAAAPVASNPAPGAPAQGAQPAAVGPALPLAAVQKANLVQPQTAAPGANPAAGATPASLPKGQTPAQSAAQPATTKPGNVTVPPGHQLLGTPGQPPLPKPNVATLPTTSGPIPTNAKSAVSGQPPANGKPAVSSLTPGNSNPAASGPQGGGANVVTTPKADSKLTGKPNDVPATGSKPAQPAVTASKPAHPDVLASKPPPGNATPNAAPKINAKPSAKLTVPPAPPKSAPPPRPAITRARPPPPRQAITRAPPPPPPHPAIARAAPPPPPRPAPPPPPRPQQQAQHIQVSRPPPPRPAPAAPRPAANKCAPGQKC